MFDVLQVPRGGTDDDYFWYDELFVSTADSEAAQGELTGRHHLAFQAKDRATVDAFHKAALAGGGTDNGAPGERPYHPGYYAAFVLRPRRQQHRGRVPRRGQAQRAFGEGHVLTHEARCDQRALVLASRTMPMKRSSASPRSIQRTTTTRSFSQSM